MEHTAPRPIFVQQATNAASKDLTLSERKRITFFPLYACVSPGRTDQYLSYFFTSFLPRNVFASKIIPMEGDLRAICSASSALRDAIDAIVTLHCSRQGQLSLIDQDLSLAKFDCLQPYTRSVRYVQRAITLRTLMDDPSALWVTFFLGLFEVCVPHLLLQDLNPQF